ncbi:hypothetical protein, partial [Serratia marcescens]|uniref:hypothetical protein n=1 Tax=Serratia marcescens TaxID=615 RepID=UPI0006653D99
IAADSRPIGVMFCIRSSLIVRYAIHLFGLTNTRVRVHHNVQLFILMIKPLHHKYGQATKETT